MKLYKVKKSKIDKNGLYANRNINKGTKNIEVLSISGLMGEAIKRISNSTSVSDLFK